MARKYPRGYLIVEGGKVEKIKVKGPVHELAVILKHPEATGTEKPEKFDGSRFLIKSK